MSSLLLGNDIVITTGQGKITSLISEIFNTNYDYFGSILSNLAKVGVDTVAIMLCKIICVVEFD